MFRFSRALVIATLMLMSFNVTGKEWREMDWTELMPPEDLHLLENMPPIEHEGDQPPLLPDEIMTGRVRPELDNTPIRIPGFVVPLEIEGNETITEFFLVPYFGACIHVPPPPPNQMIHIRYTEGFTPEALYDPFWVKGVLRTQSVSHEVGDASYAMEAVEVTLYQGP